MQTKIKASKHSAQLKPNSNSTNITSLQPLLLKQLNNITYTNIPKHHIYKINSVN